MSNELPDAFNSLTDLADDMMDGLHDHGDALAVKQWTEAALATRLTAARDAKKARRAAEATEAAFTTARKIANSNAKGFLATARRMLLDDFGPRPGADWELAGWSPGETAVPDSIAGRKKILETLVPWLGANPAKEVPQKNFTAAKGQQTLTALSDALRDLPDKIRDRVHAAAVDHTAEAALRTGMSGLVRELESLLPDDSPDWYYFGLVPPSKAEAPAPPEQIVARLATAGTVLLGCDRSPRGRKYRFAIRVEGAADWVEQPLVGEPQLLVENLPTTGTLKARVQAQNAAGNSPWSGEITIGLAPTP